MLKTYRRECCLEQYTRFPRRTASAISEQSLTQTPAHCHYEYQLLPNPDVGLPFRAITTNNMLQRVYFLNRNGLMALWM